MRSIMQSTALAAAAETVCPWNNAPVSRELGAYCTKRRINYQQR